MVLGRDHTVILSWMLSCELKPLSSHPTFSVDHFAEEEVSSRKRLGLTDHAIARGESVSVIAEGRVVHGQHLKSCRAQT